MGGWVDGWIRCIIQYITYSVFLHFLHSHLWLRSFLNRRVYESSLSGSSPQNNIENNTINAPIIGRSSPINTGMLLGRI
jgi:hypothetical protein